MLPLLTQILHCSFARPNKIANGFMARVWHPNCREFASTMKPGPCQSITAVGLDALTRLLGNEGGRDNGALVPKVCDLAVQPVSCRAGLITERELGIFPARFSIKRRTELGLLSTSPRNRTSPSRPSSAKATEILSFDVSRPTNTHVLVCMLLLLFAIETGAHSRNPNQSTFTRASIGAMNIRSARRFRMG